MTSGNMLARTLFEGFSLPSYTAVPDELFDDLMVDLSLAELRIVLYICRRTFGFKKREDAIALSQMEHGIVRRDGRVLDRGVGLSRRSLLPALRSLVSKGIVIRREQTDAHGGSRASVYSLRFCVEKKLQGGGEVTSSPGGEEIAPGGGELTSPHKKQVSTHSETTPPPPVPKLLVEEFYRALGIRPTPQKAERGEEEIARILEGGFSEDEVRYGIGYVAKKYSDTKTVSRLPFLLDEALRHRDLEEKGALSKDRQERQQLAEKEIVEKKRVEAEAWRIKFQNLPVEERQSYVDRAPKWLSLESSRLAWAVGKYQQERLSLTQQEGGERDVSEIH